MASNRPLVMRLAADVKDWLRGTDSAERSMGDLADSLDDAARDAERFDKSFTDSMRDAERAAQRAGRGIEDDIGEVGKESAQEFKQNLAEGLSSGNIEDVFQDTLGGIISGLSGAAAGAATVVAGIGALVFNGLREQAERVQQLTESAVQGIDAMYDVADQRWTQAKENQRVSEFLEENKDILAEMAPLIEGLAIDFDEYVTAIALGNQQSYAYEESLRRIVEEEEERIRNGSALTEGESKRAQQARILLDTFGGINDEQQRAFDAQQRVNGAYQRYLEMTGQARDNWQQQYNYAQRTLDTVQNIPDTIRVKLETYATGSGAAYINPYSGNYSPGHVAIANEYTNQARKGQAR